MIGGYVDSQKLRERGITEFDVVVKTGGLKGNVGQDFVVCLPSGEPFDSSAFAITEGNSAGQQNNSHLKVFVLGRRAPDSYDLFGNKEVTGPITAKGITVRLFPLDPDIKKEGLKGVLAYHLGKDGGYLRRPDLQEIVALK